MTLDPIPSIDTLSGLLRRGQSTSALLTSDALAAIARTNDVWHHFTTVTAGLAVECAVAADDRLRAGIAVSALDGVPVGIKDNIALRGYPTGMGSRVLSRSHEAAHADVVHALLAAGAVVVGKTSLDEGALGASGRNAITGDCVHPHDPDALCGGSSAGSAAAVAAGNVLLAVGTDTLGSTRLPAAFCGVAGFKLTSGRWLGGVVPLHPRWDALGLLARSPHELTVASAAVLGLQERRTPVLRNPILGVVSPATVAELAPAGAERYLAALDRLRGSCETVTLRWSAQEFRELARHALLLTASAWWSQEQRRVSGREHALGADLQRVLQWARGHSPRQLRDARDQVARASARLHAATAAMDACLLPTTPCERLDRARPVPRDVACFTIPANVLGVPAVAWRDPSHGALQLMGRRDGDAELLALAARLADLLAHAQPNAAPPRRRVVDSVPTGSGERGMAPCRH
jgi:aspartyl-tRNA(Asn)/glutamyl-tRNA(Gln) amidotransferase subunit A